MNKVVVGLCENRHKMPIKDYIFKDIPNPSDIEKIEEEAFIWVYKHCLETQKIDDFILLKGKYELVIYVTGLTVALTSILKICQAYDIKVTLMHYDKDNDNYIKQEMFYRKKGES